MRILNVNRKTTKVFFLLIVTLFLIQLNNSFISQENAINGEIPSYSIINRKSISFNSEMVLYNGSFVKVDASATGTVFLVNDSSNLKLAFQSNVNIENGPDLYVYLSTESSFSSPTDSPGSYLDLGVLPSTNGPFNVTIPSVFDISVYKSVLIYCKTYAVLFSYATLQPTGITESSQSESSTSTNTETTGSTQPESSTSTTVGTTSSASSENSETSTSSFSTNSENSTSNTEINNTSSFLLISFVGAIFLLKKKKS